MIVRQSSEQMPGAMYSLDVSSVLRAQGFWSSFNRPYVQEVYDALGYSYLNTTYGSYLFGYNGYFRQEMFAREAPRVSNLLGMQHTMRLNNWETDPWARNNSGWAISARWDLSRVPDPIPSLGWMGRGAHGGIDTKITGAAWMRNDLSSPNSPDILRVSVINGPTAQGAENPPFTWTDPEWDDSCWHEGHPDTFDFPFVEFSLTSYAGTASCHCNRVQVCQVSNDGLTARCVASTRVIVGIVLGSVFGLALLVGCIVAIRHKRSDAKSGRQVNERYGAMDYQQQA